MKKATTPMRAAPRTLPTLAPTSTPTLLFLPDVEEEDDSVLAGSAALEPDAAEDTLAAEDATADVTNDDWDAGEDVDEEDEDEVDAMTPIVVSTVGLAVGGLSVS